MPFFGVKKEIPVPDRGALGHPLVVKDYLQEYLGKNLPWGRVHLFEFNDSALVPRIFRNAVTESLRVVYSLLKVAQLIQPILEKIIADAGASRVIDLCSGPGGPILPLARGLAEVGLPIEVILTDLFSYDNAFKQAEIESHGQVRGYPKQVDARDIPDELVGLRTMFTAFHHFRPKDAHGILADAVNKNQPIAIFEITQRTWFRTLTIFPASFLGMFGMVFLMRPLKWSLIFFTYIIPAVPFIVGWDGLVSCLRSYTESEFQDLTRPLKGKPYDWTTFWVTSPVTVVRPPIICHLGLPRRAA